MDATKPAVKCHPRNRTSAHGLPQGLMHPHHSSGRAAWLRPNMGPGLSNGLRRGKPQTAAPILQDNQSCTTSLFTPRLLSYEVLGNPSIVVCEHGARPSPCVRVLSTSRAACCFTGSGKYHRSSNATREVIPSPT
jgi:hypothetical protein